MHSKQRSGSSVRRRSFSRSGSNPGGSQRRFSNNRNRNSSSNRGSYGGARGQRKGRKRDQSIDISRFINKAPEQAQEEKAFVPKHTFKTFGFDKRLVAEIDKKGFENPTHIQDESIPHIMDGKDIVGLANTGTGKTATFLLPLIHKVLNNRSQKIVVLAPTRELAQQINDELGSFTQGMRIFSTLCIGGSPIGRQIAHLRRSNDFIIGTPGRVMDLIKRGNLKLADAHTIVLDEADRMLDMGFIHDIKFVLSHMPKERHTLFFSATMSQEIKNLIHEFLNNPVTVSVVKQETAQNIDQDIISVKNREKIDVLHELLVQDEFEKVIIFGKTKRGVDRLSKDLYKKGIKTETMHGDKSQGQRKQALRNFKEGRVQHLIATDVAARGIDVDNISHVINYELPATYDDYVHRIGRTGRGGAKGKALTFVN